VVGERILNGFLDPLPQLPLLALAFVTLNGFRNHLILLFH
jgi:hypothetical protein